MMTLGDIVLGGITAIVIVYAFGYVWLMIEAFMQSKGQPPVRRNRYLTQAEKEAKRR